MLLVFDTVSYQFDQHGLEGDKATLEAESCFQLSKNVSVDSIDKDKINIWKTYS